MLRIKVFAEFLFQLDSEEDWIKKVPKIVPPKIRSGETRIWVDKYGNVFEAGVDFRAAQILDSYPCRVYRLRNVASTMPNPQPNG